MPSIFSERKSVFFFTVIPVFLPPVLQMALQLCSRLSSLNTFTDAPLDTLHSTMALIGDLLQTSQASFVRAICSKQKDTSPSNNKNNDELMTDEEDTPPSATQSTKVSSDDSTLQSCESVWSDIQVLLGELYTVIGTSWRVHGVVRAILTQSLTVLEDKGAASCLKVVMLDALFEVFKGNKGWRVVTRDGF